MSVSVFAIVLAAAIMHAAWNAVVKNAGDRTLALGLVSVGHLIPGIVLVIISPLPSLAAVPYLIASTIIHWLYFYLLNMSYRVGDLSLIYPIARGAAPLMVAVPAFFLLGEALMPLAWAGLLAISAGILLLGVWPSSRPKSSQKSSGDRPLLAIGFAVATGVMIAIYSLVDGVGVRISDDALSYIGWLFLLESVMIFYIFIPRMDRFRALSSSQIRIGFYGGLLSALAYGLVLYTKTLAPIAMVSALRETSVIFAALIGMIWLGERPITPRLIAAAIVCGGIILLGISPE